MMGKSLDAKRLKKRITYSKENREKMGKKETHLLWKIVNTMAAGGGAYIMYKLFYRRPELSKDLTEITAAIMSNADRMTQATRNKLSTAIVQLGALIRPPPPKTTRPASNLFVRVIKAAAIYAKNTTLSLGRSYIKVSVNIGKWAVAKKPTVPPQGA